MNLSSFPRAAVNFLPTPLVEMKRLSQLLGGPRLWIKRDDMTGLGMGGNKTRKLEFLLGEALDQGCDAVITGGAAQSNHCRQTAAAAAVTGLECHLALGGAAPEVAEGNLLLDGLFGAVVHWCGDQTKGEQIPAIADGLCAAGRRPYVIPYGGSNPVGALGFVAAMGELKEQMTALDLQFDAIVLPSSSGGTHAGMVVGADLEALPAAVIGIAIDRSEPGLPPYEADLADLANGIADMLGTTRRFRPADFSMRYDFFGGGYGVVGDLEREAIRLSAGREGVLLDPVYSGRAMGGLIAMIRRGDFSARDTVLFWHTGGTPAPVRAWPGTGGRVNRPVAARHPGLPRAGYQSIGPPPMPVRSRFRGPAAPPGRQSLGMRTCIIRWSMFRFLSR